MHIRDLGEGTPVMVDYNLLTQRNGATLSLVEKFSNFGLPYLHYLTKQPVADPGGEGAMAPLAL